VSLMFLIISVIFTRANHGVSTTEPGKAFVEPFDTPLGKLGMAICFDVSLAVLARIFLLCIDTRLRY